MDITSRKEAEQQLRASHEQLRDLAAHLQAAREEERAHVAREIHDRLGQALTTLKFDVAGLKDKVLTDPQTAVSQIQRISSYIDETTETVRRIATELRPAVLDNFGLLAAIEWYAQEFQQRTGIKCMLKLCPAEIDLGLASATAVFRILQEALINVARHAEATATQILVSEQKGQLILQVEDNGKGVTQEQVTNSKSLGIIGMQERAFLIGGEVVIRPARRRGTRVILRMPLRESTAPEKEHGKNSDRR